VGYSLLILFFIINTILQKNDYYNAVDCPREVSNYLEEIINEDELVFTSNAPHIIYYLLDISPPAKYVHPSLIFIDVHYNAFGIDPETEIREIFLQKPDYVITKSGMSNRIILENLERYYTLNQSFNTCNVKVYKRIKKVP
jgi:hypothetical protein